ncbi:MAG TPA: DinB family protein [Trebonia sp.]|nr:DinB family protein [Trebonia sp.]
MSEADEKETLRHYLQDGRAALLWKLAGLSDYDIRRPMTPTGTNLLGLVKHCAAVECTYFGRVVGRPFPGEGDLDWHEGDDTVLNGDMYAAESESREQVTGFYRRVWAHSDETIGALSLDARGTVDWWPEARRNPTLRTLLVHTIQETARHAGHADIIRESIDGAAGLREGSGNLPAEVGAAAWKQHHDTLESIARSAH